ncbi:CDP-glycerol glycerophosphotransferase family protein [Methylorubrum salsuginis]|uniref:CDP-glycerol glycerophosphotransferase, TagB/SpsB family n=1 Tax=Methylorubrum salsuginis TaxID=414703 RepID=A0A1I4F503_9HYPH|nr:CDP-glycerol glycerophosphotransferase family protein [Methylorubrum salsuginis]SFL11471.1 CDP-glycerol glycerophosphotransferase, TagB/SpsB family [Methylorubrum salsuginis]
MTSDRSFVLVIHQYRWHTPILGPLAVRLGADNEVLGLTMAAFEAAWDDGSWQRERVPDLVVVADAGTAVHLRARLPDALILHVGHGLISKNVPGQTYGAADYVCVASEAAAARLTARGHVPRRGFLPTGLIQADPLFAGASGRDGVRVPGCTASLVYAPTWNPSLSSAPMLGDALVTLMRGAEDGVGILIKPHPHIAVAAPEWIETWRDCARNHPNVIVHPPEADLIPALLGADLLVSDASSAIFHFLALNRPIVLIDNPERFATPECYDPDGIEWRWRDIGTRVEFVGELATAVLTALADPERNEAARMERRADLFGERTDGCALDRVGAAAERILRETRQENGRG